MVAQNNPAARVRNYDTKGLLGVKSKYEEDVLKNGHSSVWGSYWHSYFGWGFRCCYSFNPSSLCKGEEQMKETIKKEYEYELTLTKLKDEESKLKVQIINKKMLKDTSTVTPQEEIKKQTQ